MAKSAVLDRVYKTIAHLRAKGEKINIENVAKVAGLARSTFYLDDLDWKEVREVIKGKPSSRVQLIKIEISEDIGDKRKLAELGARVERAERELESVRRTAETVYRKLVDQLQYYFALASETPAKKAKQAQMLKESGSAAQELKRLQAENLSLREQVRQTPITAPLINKRYITLPNELSISAYYSAFLDQLAQTIPDERVGQVVGAVFVICGFPSAGKTQWANDHRPVEPGAIVYVDGTSHSAEIRGFITDRIRRLTQAPIRCVRVRTDRDACFARSGQKYRGAAHIRMSHVIESVALAFEEVTFAEQFDAIILA